MLIFLLGNKQILQTSKTNSANNGMATGRQNRSEELLMFGCQALTVLFEKIQTFKENTPEENVNQQILNRVFLMLLNMESKKVRQQLTGGLEKALQNSCFISSETLSLIKNMNVIKKGLADQALDFDKVLNAIKSITEVDMTKSNAIQ